MCMLITQLITATLTTKKQHQHRQQHQKSEINQITFTNKYMKLFEQYFQLSLILIHEAHC